ncbi:hypothetical protein D3C87_1995920 [compost metagenome]
MLGQDEQDVLQIRLRARQQQFDRPVLNFHLFDTRMLAQLPDCFLGDLSRLDQNFIVLIRFAAQFFLRSASDKTPVVDNADA